MPTSAAQREHGRSARAACEFVIVRNGLRYRVISGLSSRVGPAVLGRLTGTNLILPYYHLVSDVENVYVKNLYAYKTTREFTQDLDFLLRHYSPIDLQDLLTQHKSGRPIKANAFLLTFDDGFREVFDVIAPILRQKGVNATFFINSAFVDNQDLCYLNKASLLVEKWRAGRSAGLERRVSDFLRAYGIQGPSVSSGILSVTYSRRHLLDELAALLEVDVQHHLRRDQPYLTTVQIRKLLEMGFTIGGHSIDHPLYALLPIEEQLRETTASVSSLRQAFGLDYGAFAFPHHDNGVSSEFFARLRETGLVDISFGTAGLVYDSAPNHLQRFSLEKPLDSGERILAFQHVRKLARIVTGRATIARN
jgi:peptidoglycan/xylan/chitin deacetylase (PgdA/CDA1 family)